MYGIMGFVKTKHNGLLPSIILKKIDTTSPLCFSPTVREKIYIMEDSIVKSGGCCHSYRAIFIHACSFSITS